MRDLTPTVKYLLIINIVMFAIQQVIITIWGIDLNSYLGLYYFGLPEFKFYQLFTNFFMHAGYIHLAFNMISLYSIGVLLERFWGSKRLFNFYLMCGIGAGIFHLIVHMGFMYNNLGHILPTIDELMTLSKPWAVGASGAVFGMFTAVALLFPNSEFYVFFIPFPIKAKYLLIAAVIISVYLGTMNFSGDPIGHFAHLGGIITGFILVKLHNKNSRRFY